MIRSTRFISVTVLSVGLTACSGDDGGTATTDATATGTATLGTDGTDATSAGTDSSSGGTDSSGTTAGSDSASSGTTSAGTTDGTSGGTTAGTSGGTTAGTSGGTTAGTSGSGGTTGGSSGGSGTSGGSTGGVSATSGGTTGGTTGNTTGNNTTGNQEECVLNDNLLPCDDQDNELFHALGLNCDSLGGNWTANNSIPITNTDIQAATDVYRVGTMFGNAAYAAIEGQKVLIMSSSLMPGADGGVITETNTSQDVGGAPWDDNNLPPPMVPMDGDTNPDPNIIDCNLVGDCTNTIEAQWTFGGSNPNDKMWFNFDLTAPAQNQGAAADALGYKFDFAYLSQEFPDYVDSTYNDMFIVWQSSTNFTGNVVFINDQPITVTALWDDATGVDYIGECPSAFDPVPVINGCTGNDPALQGTGLSSNGAGTDWYTATGGIEPGETFTMSFAIMDMGDSILDSYAVVDNFRWSCEGCVPNEVDSCGVEPQ